MTLLHIKILISLFYKHPFDDTLPVRVAMQELRLEGLTLSSQGDHQVTAKGEKWLKMLVATPLPEWCDPRITKDQS